MPVSLVAATIGAGMAYLSMRIVGAEMSWSTVAYYWFFMLALIAALTRAWDWRGNAAAGAVLGAAAAVVMIVLGSDVGAALAMGGGLVLFTVVAGLAMRKLLGAPDAPRA